MRFVSSKQKCKTRHEPVKSLGFLSQDEASTPIQGCNFWRVSEVALRECFVYDFF